MTEALKEWHVKRVREVAIWTVPEFGMCSLLALTQMAVCSAIDEVTDPGRGLTMEEYEEVTGIVDEVGKSLRARMRSYYRS